MVENLKTMKSKVIKWERAKKKELKVEFFEIEGRIKSVLSKFFKGVLRTK